MKISILILCISIIAATNFESKNSSSFIGKICGGLTVEARDEKFLASLRREGKHICTAFLIAAKHAVTTAACLNDFLNKTEFADFNSYSLVVGRLDLAGGSAPLLIKSVQAHSRYIYDRPVAKYDVGLIKLRKNVTESEYIGFGALAQEDVSLSKTTELTSWGNAFENTSAKQFCEFTSKKTFFIVVEKNICGFRLDSPIICAQNLRKDVVLTMGDLGAPLSQNNFIVGILAILPNKLRRAAVFVNVFKAYLDIKKMMTRRVTSIRKILPRKRARYKKEDKITEQNYYFKPT